jgi:hypothetical protein
LSGYCGTACSPRLAHPEEELSVEHDGGGNAVNLRLLLVELRPHGRDASNPQAGDLGLRGLLGAIVLESTIQDEPREQR